MITFRGEQLTIIPLVQPAPPTLVRQGSAGTTTYGYKVVARHTTGHSQASTESTVMEGASALDATHFIQITPSYVLGAQLYDVYRTTGPGSTGKLGTLVPVVNGSTQLASLPDYGQAPEAGAPPVENTSGVLFMPGIATGDFLQVGPDGLIIGTTDLSGTLAFTGLTDTLTSYRGLGGELLTVKDTEDGLTTVSVGTLLATVPDADASHTGLLTAADWTTFHNKQDALGYVPEDVAHKSTNTALGSSDTLYPTQNAVKAYVDDGLSAKQDVQGTGLQLLKRTTAAAAPGDGRGLLRWEAGTDSGTLKLVAYSGTDTTGVTIVDNVGSGNT